MPSARRSWAALQPSLLVVRRVVEFYVPSLPGKQEQEQEEQEQEEQEQEQQEQEQQEQEQQEVAPQGRIMTRVTGKAVLVSGWGQKTAVLGSGWGQKTAHTATLGDPPLIYLYLQS